MEVENVFIEGVKIIHPKTMKDSRGYFCETYNSARYKAAGIDSVFVQDNESFSMKGVVRGLHWQVAPYSQAKLVRVIKGAVWDVAVDIRKGSPTFGKYFAYTLRADEMTQLYIPRGFAHGFIVLENNTLFSYKCDNIYNPGAERGLKFDDPAIGIKWPDIGVELTLSEKDKRHPLLKDIEPVSIYKEKNYGKQEKRDNSRRWGRNASSSSNASRLEAASSRI